MQTLEEENLFKLNRYEYNPLNLPLYGANGCVHPDIHYFKDGLDGYKFWLYYTPYPPQDKEYPFLVRSNDGFNFDDTGVSNPLITKGRRGWDSEYLADPDITISEKQWYMYFAGNYKIQQIGVAISSDGKNWIKDRKNPIITKKKWERATGKKLEKGIRCPTSFYDKDEEKIYLYFSAKHDGIEEIYLATSLDGFNFNIYSKPVIEVGSSGEFDSGFLNHLDIVCFGKYYWIFYVGGQARDSSKCMYSIGLAKSKDKIHWEKVKHNPLMVPEREYEGSRLYRASPCLVDNKIWLYYSVNDHLKKQRCICLAKIE